MGVERHIGCARQRTGRKHCRSRKMSLVPTFLVHKMVMIMVVTSNGTIVYATQECSHIGYLL